MRGAVLALVLSWLSAGCHRAHPCTTISDLHFDAPPPEAYPGTVENADRPLAIVGDTQRTSFEECLIGREVNDEATKHVLSDIARARPGLLVIVGDMVFEGSSHVHWQWFDALMLPIREAKIPVLPALGNHEYFGSEKDARREIALRFPRLRETTHYQGTYGRLGLVWLDSNAGAIGKNRWEEQRRWFAGVARDFEANPAIAGVLVFLHHAPYTNSNVVDGDVEVRKDLLPVFNASSKTIAMVTGHAHGYEHFLVASKHFFVSAGGGGPRGTLHAPRPGEPADLYVGSVPRPFNYLLVHQSDVGVRVETWGFHDAAKATERLEVTEIPLARTAR